VPSREKLAGMMTDEPDDLRAWALRIRSRRNFNLAAVALARSRRESGT